MNKDTGSQRTHVWRDRELYPAGYGPDGALYRYYVQAPDNLLKEMRLRPDSYGPGPFRDPTGGAVRYDSTGNLIRLRDNPGYIQERIALLTDFKGLHNMDMLLKRMPQFYNELLDYSRFSLTNPNRAHYNCWEGLFVNTKGVTLDY